VSTDDELNRAFEAVIDEATFLRYVELLLLSRRRADQAKPDDRGRLPDGWENHSIADFLEAALRWVEDSQFGRGEGLASQSAWKRVAAFLRAGGMYE